MASVADAATPPLSREVLRSRRKRSVRSKTESIKRLPKFRLRMLADEQLPSEVYLERLGLERPVTRGDCGSVPRPCPFFGCRYNLAIDVSDRTGAIKHVFPDLEELPGDLSCALDVAESNQTLERTGEIMNLTRERVRQIEVTAAKKMRLKGGARLAQLADEGGTHPESLLQQAQAETGGRAADEGEDGWRDVGGVGRVGNPEEVFRARVYRVYLREQNERDARRSGIEFLATKLTELDELALARWANEVHADVRAGMPLIVAMAMANDEADLGEEDPPVTIDPLPPVPAAPEPPPASETKLVSRPPAPIARVFVAPASGPAEIVAAPPPRPIPATPKRPPEERTMEKPRSQRIIELLTEGGAMSMTAIVEQLGEDATKVKSSVYVMASKKLIERVGDDYVVRSSARKSKPAESARPKKAAPPAARTNGHSNGHANGHAPSTSPLVELARERRLVLAKEMAAIDALLEAVGS